MYSKRDGSQLTTHLVRVFFSIHLRCLFIPFKTIKNDEMDEIEIAQRRRNKSDELFPHMTLHHRLTLTDNILDADQ